MEPISSPYENHVPAGDEHVSKDEMDHYQKLIRGFCQHQCYELQTIKAKATTTALVTKPVMVIVVWGIKDRPASIQALGLGQQQALHLEIHRI